MSTKVKNFFKGLRYISQLFAEEKEEEFKIGLPTDVKHVAHIGSDDPSANAPSWMTEFKGGKEPSGNVSEILEDSSHSKPTKNRRHGIPKSRHQSIDTESNAPKPKGTRRQQRSSDPSADASTHDSSTGGSRHRRSRRGSNHGSETASQELPPNGVTKAPRRRSKNSEDGSTKKPSSRRSSKGDSLSDISITDFGPGPENAISAQ